VELDVRPCATGEVVVMHDANLLRVTAGDDRRPVARVPLGELAEVRLGPSREPIPTLREVIAWANEHTMALNVEIKRDVPSRVTLARTVAGILKDAKVPVVISSFDPLVLAATAALLRAIPRALLTDRAQSSARALQAIARPPLIYALHVERTRARAESIRRWKARGLRVGVWTVNDAAEARSLAGGGADLLITDAPAVILAAVSQWLTAW